MPSDNFPACFDFTIAAEGGYTNNSADNGNWTGGVIGSGTCKGTKFGISAAAYPDLDIANLTQADAEAIYRRDYWAKVRGDTLPLPMAYVAFDGAVNSGVLRSILWLQAAAGVRQDGNFGPVTLAAVLAGDAEEMAKNALARRGVFLAGQGAFATFGLGWLVRLVDLAGVVSLCQAHVEA